jgi:alpha,alpha-trehalase
MLDLDPAFRPVTRPDGHRRLEDLGLVGDGQTVALVGLVASGVNLARATQGSR